MKNIYQSILFSLCTATFTDCKCGKEKLELIKDPNHTIRQNHPNNDPQKLQKEEPENSITEDKLFPISIKLKNKDNENDIAQSDLSNEQQKIESEPEPEVKENKPNETLEQQVLRQLEEIWRNKIPDGVSLSVLRIKSLLKTVKELNDKDQKLYKSYYLSLESETAKDKMERLEKHYNNYSKALKTWCAKLPPKELQLLLAKIKNNSKDVYLEKICMESALDPISKKSLVEILTKHIENETSYITDYMKNPEILNKIPNKKLLRIIPVKEKQKLILDMVEKYKIYQEKRLEKLKKE